MRPASGNYKTSFYRAIGKRDHQEDSSLIFTRNGRSLFAVADGMGGHGHGNVASSEFLKGLLARAEQLEAMIATLAAEQPREPTKDQVWPRLVPGQLKALKQALVSCVEAGLSTMRQTKEASINKDMGNTLTAAWCCGHEVVWAQVGDSRLYHLAAGVDCARQVTQDQCYPYPNENVLRRACTADPDNSLIWDAESLGSFVVQPGDVLILCSDGVSGYLDPDPERGKKQRLASAGLAPGLFLGQRIRSGPLGLAAQDLVNCADSMGGHDNMTAIVAEVL